MFAKTSSPDKSLYLWLFWERASYRYHKHFIIFKKKKNRFKRLKLYFMEQKAFFKCKHPNWSQEVHCGSSGRKVKEAIRVARPKRWLWFVDTLNWRQLQTTAKSGKSLFSAPLKPLSPPFFGLSNDRVSRREPELALGWKHACPTHAACKLPVRAPVSALSVSLCPVKIRSH